MELQTQSQPAAPQQARAHTHTHTQSTCCSGAHGACSVKDGYCPLPRPLLPHFIVFLSELKFKNENENILRLRPGPGELVVAHRR